MLDSLRRNVSGRAIVFAWLGGSIMFLLTSLILTPVIAGVDPRIILRYMASLLLGESAVTDLSMATLMFGVLVHFVLSFAFTILITFVIHRGGMLIGLIGGAILGLALYGINFYTMTYFFEWFFALNSTALLASHIVFGVVVGGIYEYFDAFDLPVQEMYS